MAFVKAKIDITFLNGERTTIPCFKILAPFIVDKMKYQQGADIKHIDMKTISHEEYVSLLKLQDHPSVEMDITSKRFWDIA